MPGWIEHRLAFAYNPCSRLLLLANSESHVLLYLEPEEAQKLADMIDNRIEGTLVLQSSVVHVFHDSETPMTALVVENKLWLPLASLPAARLVKLLRSRCSSGG